jgi:hypothetical protein
MSTLNYLSAIASSSAFEPAEGKSSDVKLDCRMAQLRQLEWLCQDALSLVTTGVRQVITGEKDHQNEGETNPEQLPGSKIIKFHNL